MITEYSNNLLNGGVMIKFGQLGYPSIPYVYHLPVLGISVLTFILKYIYHKLLWTKFPYCDLEHQSKFFLCSYVSVCVM